MIIDNNITTVNKKKPPPIFGLSFYNKDLNDESFVEFFFLK